MKTVKHYLQGWDKVRTIKLILAAVLFATYYFYPLPILMAFGSILSLQAILNLSCPGGSCTTTTNEKTAPIIKTEKYEPKN